MNVIERLLPNSSTLVRATYILFALFALAVPIVRFGLLPLGATAVQAADILFVVVAALFAVGVLKGTFRLPPLLWLLPSALLFLGAALSIVGSDAIRASLVKLVATGYLLSIGIVTYGLAVRSPQAWRFILGSWSAAATLTALLGAVGVLMFYAGIRDRSVNVFLWNYGSLPAGGYPRIVVFFQNANMLCGYLLVGLGTLGMLAADAPRRARTAYVAAAMLICFTTLFTLSTGLGGLALGVALSWVLWRLFSRRFSVGREALVGGAGLASAAGMAIVTIFLLVPKGKGDVHLGPVDLSLETSGRVSVWASSWGTFEQHPVAGLGLGKLVAETSNPHALNTSDKIGTDQMRTTPSRMEAHNIWLNVAGQMGLAGLLPFVFLVGLVTKAAWPTKGMAPPWREAKIAAFGCLVGAVFYHGLFGSFEDSRQYWFLFGAILASDRLSQNALDPKPVALDVGETEASALLRRA